MRLEVGGHVAFEVLDGQAVILDLDAVRYYSLNGTATCVWEAIAGGADVAYAVQAVARRFDVDEDAARADVDALVHRLVELGILKRSD